jgi:hypothetical protein
LQELAVPSFDAATARAVGMALGRREEVPVGAKSERFGIWNLQGRKMNKTRQKRPPSAPMIPGLRIFRFPS